MIERLSDPLCGLLIAGRAWRVNTEWEVIYSKSIVNDKTGLCALSTVSYSY